MPLMDKKIPNLWQNICPARKLAEEIYEGAARDGLVPPLTHAGRGRPKRDVMLAGMVAVTAHELGIDKTAKLLDQMYPAGRIENLAESRCKRVRRYLAVNKERQKWLLNPIAAEAALDAPEVRLERLERLLEHYIGMARAQWLRAEGITPPNEAARSPNAARGREETLPASLAIRASLSGRNSGRKQRA